MREVALSSWLLFSILVVGFGYSYVRSRLQYGAPPYVADVPQQYHLAQDEWDGWTRPPGPLRVGLQVGHWKNDELPDELSRIRESGSGTSNGQIAEWEVALKIAQETKNMLEQEGVVVDLIPATVPREYFADAFVAIHADGSLDPGTTGFKVAGPRWDRTGKADDLAGIIEDEYARQTGMAIDPNITRNMTGYYAFSWRRYRHAVHPMTTAVILETGFLTNPEQAKMLIHSPQIPAKALSRALLTYLQRVKTS
jgi:hypothetical protein